MTKNILYECKIYQTYIQKFKEKSIPLNTEIVLYCERGSLSINCAKEIAKMGYVFYNLLGGYQNYKS
jgi:rhodanese-related sulfurtransferase